MTAKWAALAFAAAFGVLTGFSIGMPVLVVVAGVAGVYGYRGRFDGAPRGVPAGLAAGAVLTAVLAPAAVLLVLAGACSVLFTSVLVGYGLHGARVALR